MLKKGLLTFMCAISIFIISGCSGNQNDINNVDSLNHTEETQDQGELDDTIRLNDIKKEGNSYYNSKYGFGIVVPKEWNVSEESPSGDGIQLYDKNGNDIRVYGGYRIIPPDFEKEEIDEKRKLGMNVMEMINSQGQKGFLIVGEEDGKEYFKYVILGQEKHCSFYAKVTKDYYQTNESVLLEIAKTLELSENNLMKVSEVVSKPKNKNYSYKIEFYLDAEKNGSEGATFNRFKGFKLTDNAWKLIFDSAEFESLVIDGVRGNYDNPEEAVRVDDKTGNGSEEIIIKLEDGLGYPTALVIGNVKDKYVVLFHGYVYDEVEFIDVDNDGVKELLNDHPGGGGYTSTWLGLKLVNRLKDGEYRYSYNLTKKYYEDIKNEKERIFNGAPTETNLVYLLNAYADLGMPDKCEELMKNNESLINSTFDFSKFYSGPDDDFFSYVVRRALDYKSYWDEMKQ